MYSARIRSNVGRLMAVPTFSGKSSDRHARITQFDKRSGAILKTTTSHQNVLGTDISMNQAFGLLQKGVGLHHRIHSTCNSTATELRVQIGLYILFYSNST